jgi:hypothetical protein
MKSYTTGRAFFGSLTKDTSSANLTLGDEMANDDYRKICAKRDWPWLERLRTLTTIASTQNYNLPYDCDLVRSINVVVSSKTYVPRHCPSRQLWDRLNYSTQTSDIPEWYYVYNGQVGLWPKPASASNTINVNQKCRVIDLSAADYTTGTIVSVANGGTAVVGSGTSWTAQMVGRFIRITHIDTAGTGDGEWYEISAVTDATHLTLTRAYGGTAIAAGSATYIIGQMPWLPETFHPMPWIRAAAIYWAKEDDTRAAGLQTMYDDYLADLFGGGINNTTDLVINDGGRSEIINPNLTISL